jgi:hypothetical protein
VSLDTQSEKIIIKK